MIFEEKKIMSAIDSWLYKINLITINESIEIKLIRELQVTERKDNNQQKKEPRLVRNSS